MNPYWQEEKQLANLQVRLGKTENQIQRAGVDVELLDCTFGAVKSFQ